MQLTRPVVGSLVALLGLGVASAHAGVAVGIRLGIPLYFGPSYPCYGYYRPYYPVYVAPPPVIVQPAPYVQPAQVVQPVYASPPPPVAATSAPAPAPAPALRPVVSQKRADIDRHLQLLGDANENVRADSAIQLGRLRAPDAVDPLTATLAGDRSPVVREAAARALGLIGSPRATPALQQAAQADSDRDVRNSARFALDVIQTTN